MASISKHTGGYRAQVYVHGRRKSRVHRTMREAQAWAAAEEAQLAAPPGDRHTVGDLIERYAEEVMSRKKGGDHEARQAKALLRDFPALAAKKLSEVDTPDMAAWRDARLKVVGDATILRQINWLRHAFRVAREEWKWMDRNPLKGMRLPSQPSPRERRVSPAEVRALCRNLGYRPNRTPETKNQEVALVFMVALRSAMRAGEILSLGRGNLNLERRVASVAHKTQHLTGRPRDVPLTRHAVRLLRPVADRERCFAISSASLDTLFRKARDRLLIEDLHFHDTRAEAPTRLARKVDVMTLGKISGHKSLNLLMDTYYRETAAEIAARLRPPPAPGICPYSASASAGPGVRRNQRQPTPRPALPRARADSCLRSYLSPPRLLPALRNNITPAALAIPAECRTFTTWSAAIRPAPKGRRPGQMTITRTAHDHYKAALALRNRILDGAVNETPVQAWAAVARECAKAEDAFRRENEGRVHGRSQQAFLTNLDRVAWYARAQVETIARAGR